MTPPTRFPRRFSALCAAVATALAAPSAVADEPASAAPAPAEPPPGPLDPAYALLRDGRYDDAGKALDAAAAAHPNLSRDDRARLFAARAQVLLLRKKPSEEAARAAILDTLHLDPDGRAFRGAPVRLGELVDRLRGEQALVLHDPPPPSPPWRPLKVRARVSDPLGKVATLTLRLKGVASSVWTAVPMKREAAGWSALVRDPLAFAPEGVKDGFFIDYYLTAEDAAQAVLDSNGSEAFPLSATFGADAAPAPAAEPELPRAPVGPVVAPAPAKPWYLETWALATGGAVLAGLTAGLLYAALHEKPLEPHIGVLELP